MVGSLSTMERGAIISIDVHISEYVHVTNSPAICVIFTFIYVISMYLPQYTNNASDNDQTKEHMCYKYFKFTDTG